MPVHNHATETSNFKTARALPRIPVQFSASPYNGPEDRRTSRRGNRVREESRGVIPAPGSACDARDDVRIRG